MSGLTSAATRGRFFTGLVATLIGVAFTTQLHADLLNPTNFTSLGTFDVTNGNYIIDTDALTISETNASSTNLLFTGVMDDQGGQADSYGPGTNVTAEGALGIPYVAVFTFDSIELGSNALVSIIGHRALALLSQGAAKIDTALDLSAESGALYTVTTNFVPRAGPGGFAGGGITTSGGGSLVEDGHGPGGGGATAGFAFYDFSGAGGGFGAGGHDGEVNPGTVVPGVGGAVYGDPFLSVLQGGSGGGTASDSTNLLYVAYEAAGGSGGGALAIGAVGPLDLGPQADLRANGQSGGVVYDSGLLHNNYGGRGSGGGILLFGRTVTLTGSVSAYSDDSIGSGTFNAAGGGGRVAILGFGLGGSDDYIVGVTDPALIETSQINVGPGPYGTNAQVGTIALSGLRTIVTSGHSLQLGSVIEFTNASSHLMIRNSITEVRAGGEVTVPANGLVFSDGLELTDPLALVTGSGTLTNRGLITGSGAFQIVLLNDTGGRISTIENALAFAAPVTNQTGGTISAIDSILDFAGGLNNLGAINLINTTVTGNVTNNGAMSLAGTNAFTGVVIGAGNFSGAGTAQFDGTYSPGNSPAAVSFEGSVTFSPSATLHLELGGTNAGSQYDQLNVANDATLGGALDVVLIDRFVPAAGEVFHLINAGTTLGSFAAISLPTLPGGLEWQNNLNTDGTIAVIAPIGAGPQFSSVVLSGSGLIFSGTGGVTNGSYVLLSSTNVALPLVDWIPVSTNPFDANGNFMLTNPINPSQPREFYRLQQQ